MKYVLYVLYISTVRSMYAVPNRVVLLLLLLLLLREFIGVVENFEACISEVRVSNNSQGSIHSN